MLLLFSNDGCHISAEEAAPSCLLVTGGPPPPSTPFIIVYTMAHCHDTTLVSSSSHVIKGGGGKCKPFRSSRGLLGVKIRPDISIHYSLQDSPTYASLTLPHPLLHTVVFNLSLTTALPKLERCHCTKAANAPEGFHICWTWQHRVGWQQHLREGSTEPLSCPPGGPGTLQGHTTSTFCPLGAT